MSTSMAPRRDGHVIADRPSPGAPRKYDFPAVTTTTLANGLIVVVADLPGRPLVSASVVVRGGASDEPAGLAGAAVLGARALTEGTARRDAIALTEAAERLGATLHAEAGWDALSIGVDVPADRLPQAFELVAEVLLEPTFPAGEVERLRDERLNDILQARADPRRRVEEAFTDTIYAASSPYHRPAGGTPDTVAELTSASLRSVYEANLAPGRAAVVIGGDLHGHDPVAIVDGLLGDWRGTDAEVAIDRARADGAIDDRPSPVGRHVRVVHRPGSVQTEIRIGHRGLPRRIPDFHAVSVMGAILGGLFSSRLNMKLREEKGYTYGAGAGFDMRRGAGPFASRAAVNTEVTVAAILDTLAELTRMRETPVTDAELRAARDYLIGVFPLRFETAGAVVGALGGLFVHDLGVEELVGYRRSIEAVDVEAVASAAAHIRLDEASIVLVGDVDAFGADLEAAGLGRIVIDRDEAPTMAGGPGDVDEPPGPVDDEGEVGPTAGAESPPAGGEDDQGDRPSGIAGEVGPD